MIACQSFIDKLLLRLQCILVAVLLSTGEVVTVAEGQRRLAAYAAAGQSHTYLMDLTHARASDR
jgi:hypothetical protein